MGWRHLLEEIRRSFLVVREELFVRRGERIFLGFGLHFLERVGDPQLRAGCRPHEAGSNSEGSWAGHTG